MLTQEQIESVAAGCSAEIQNALKDRVTKMVVDAAGWELEQSIKKQVSAFLEKEVAPEVAKFLVENKDGLIKSACEAASQVGDLFRDSAIEAFKTKMKTDWQRRQVIEAIFKA